jgi:phosphoribosylaminoimidazole-succinocarboxamide synthase
MISKKIIRVNIPTALKIVKIKGLGKRESGKVRDWYVKDNLRIIITTDRISAFDKVLGLVPFRGAVLNKLSEFWFEKTRDIVPNHMIGVIDPNVMLVSECQALPVEIVVRAYITGVTETSLWKQYSDGKRIIYGIKFPDGLVKNQKLKNPVITPTTRATDKDGHDKPITKQEIIKKGLIPKPIYNQIEKVALKLFERGTKIADKAGFILADTKYEFGIDRKGKLILIDEIHTPDSSRFWDKISYREKFKKGEEPENYDKEIMRLWFAKLGYTGRGKAPQLPETVIIELSERYMEVYERLTGEPFAIDTSTPALERIIGNLSKLL